MRVYETRTRIEIEAILLGKGEFDNSVADDFKLDLARVPKEGHVHLSHQHIESPCETGEQRH